MSGNLWRPGPAAGKPLNFQPALFTLVPPKKPASKRVKGPVPIERLARHAGVSPENLSRARQSIANAGLLPGRGTLSPRMAVELARSEVWKALVPETVRHRALQSLFRSRSLVRRYRLGRVSLVDANELFMGGREGLSRIRSEWFYRPREPVSKARVHLTRFLRSRVGLRDLDRVKDPEVRQRRRVSLRRAKAGAAAALSVLDFLETSVLAAREPKLRRRPVLVGDAINFQDSLFGEAESNLTRLIHDNRETGLEMPRPVRERYAALVNLADLLMQWEEAVLASNETRALHQRLMRDLKLAQSPNPLARHLRSKSRMN